MNIELFATLIIIHVLGDFALQTDRIYIWKTQGGPIGLAIHVMLHLVATILLINQTPQLWLFLISLGGVHYVIDWTKLRFKGNQNAVAFLADQIAHLIHLIALSFMFSDLTGVISAPWVYGLALYAVLPAVTMCLWVWAYDLEGRVNDNLWAAEWRLSMKPMSQAFGVPLVFCMVVSAVMFVF